MKPEDLFAAIGGLESSRLERSERAIRQSSREINEEDVTMKRKNTRKIIRNLLIAAAAVSIMSVTVYAAVNARIALQTTKFQNQQTAAGEPTETYDVELAFKKTSNEYLELGSCYPQEIPDGYTCTFVSDAAMGMQRLVYEDADGEFAFDFIMQLGGDGGQRILENVVKEESVMVNELPGTLYTMGSGERCIVWTDEAQGVGFTISCSDQEIDLLALAGSVREGTALTPTLSSEYGKALEELGDYRITALPDGFQQTNEVASPLESGGGWYAYVRRWYGDKITADQTIYFEYEHFALVSDEPMNHPTEPVENTPETVLAQMGGGEPATIQGMPGAVQDEAVIWVNWDAQVSFRISAPGKTAQELLALAESVQRFN